MIRVHFCIHPLLQTVYIYHIKNAKTFKKMIPTVKQIRMFEMFEMCKPPDKTVDFLFVILDNPLINFILVGGF